MPSIFLLGATGYIGGSVLVALKQRLRDYSVTVLIRNEQFSHAIEALGVNVIKGTFQDSALISHHCSTADVVINTADSDDVSLISAIISGMHQKYRDTGIKGILIHTSGVAVCLDGKTNGQFDEQGRIWDDSNQDDIKSITPNMIHGAVDHRVLCAGEQGFLRAYIICPGAVVGRSSGPVRNGSFFLKFLVQVYQTLKHAIYVGEGSNTFYLIHLSDLVSLYLHILSSALVTSDYGSPYSEYYFAVTAAFSWKLIAGAIGEALAKRSLLQSSAPRSVVVEELDRSLSFLGANQRINACRASSTGWTPRMEDLLAFIDEGVDEAVHPNCPSLALQ